MQETNDKVQIASSHCLERSVRLARIDVFREHDQTDVDVQSDWPLSSVAASDNGVQNPNPSDTARVYFIHSVVKLFTASLHCNTATTDKDADYRLFALYHRYEIMPPIAVSLESTHEPLYYGRSTQTST